ncbi:MAG TPA: PspC domain-containing protein [Acidimicrobiales bacterium]|nr:PspC domain-containing protein [Acidimicrobiales bacterium]
MDSDTTSNATDESGDAGAEASRAASGRPADERLHRSRRDRMVAGVAGGLADYLGVDPTIVRLSFVALAVMGGLAVPLYLAGWLVIPDEDGGPTVAEELLARERARH